MVQPPVGKLSEPAAAGRRSSPRRSGRHGGGRSAASGRCRRERPPGHLRPLCGEPVLDGRASGPVRRHGDPRLRTRGLVLRSRPASRRRPLAEPARCRHRRRRAGPVRRAPGRGRRGPEAGGERVGLGRGRGPSGPVRRRRDRPLAGVGRPQLPELPARSRVGPDRCRGHRGGRPGSPADRLSDGPVRPLLPGPGLDHRHQRASPTPTSFPPSSASSSWSWSLWLLVAAVRTKASPRQ